MLCGLLLSTLNPQPSTVFAQGSLTPPGAPAGTMKTLQQIEPRTPISSLPFFVNTPGSYYVTTNLAASAGSSGIIINASDVTIDLNGFELVGITNGSTGINVGTTRSNVVVRNGAVRDWLFGGVDLSACRGAEIRDITVLRCGANGMAVGESSRIINCNSRGNTGDGIFTGTTCVVTECTAASNGADGIQTGLGSVISRCTAASNGGNGFNLGSIARIVDCVARQNGAAGISAGTRASISGCTISENVTGINTAERSQVSNCSAGSQTGDGIVVGIGSTVTACQSGDNGGIGINGGSGCVISECSVYSNTGPGIDSGNGSLIQKCTAYSNSTNGINVTSSMVTGCQVRANTSSGIRVNGNSFVLDNSSTGNGLAGIAIVGSGNRIENNLVTFCGTGIDAASPGNVIIRNSVASSSGVNYELVSGNKVGVILNATSSGAISGSSGGAGMGTNDPYANFSF